MTLFADNFLAGAVLTLLLPTLLLIAIASYLHLSMRRVPNTTPRSAPSLPDQETLAAAEAEDALLDDAVLEPESQPRTQDTAP